MTSTTRSRRLTGLDLARAVAMLAMLIAHYVESGQGSGLGAMVRDFVDGRAMPLFMVLGGVGITLLTARSTQPDRDLITRAVILLPMGLALQEATTDLAIILQYYAVFFVVAVGLRRLGDRGLLATVVIVVAVGAVTKQALAPPALPSYGGWEGLSSFVDPGLWWAILVNGYYPFFPAGAFLVTGMWLGRRRLDQVAARLTWAGAAMAVVGSWVGAWIGDQVGALPTDVAVYGFRWQRLFDATGHSEMPAWIIGTMGSSLMVIGASLIVARRWRLPPLVLLGRLALTFYVYQAVVINWTPERPTTTTAQEYLLCVALTLGFLAWAIVWARFVSRRGPLEWVLRAGAGTPAGLRG